MFLLCVFAEHLVHRGPGSLHEILDAMKIGIYLLLVEVTLSCIASFVRK